MRQKRMDMGRVTHFSFDPPGRVRWTRLDKSNRPLDLDLFRQEVRLS